MANPLYLLRERAQWYVDGCPDVDDHEHYLLKDLAGDAGADLQAALAIIDALLPALKNTTAELREIHAYFYRDIHGGTHFEIRGEGKKQKSPCKGGCPAEIYCAAADAAIQKAEQ